MASIRERTTKASGTTFNVLFRQGGAQKSKTFGNAKDAKRLKQLIDTLGVERGLSAFADEHPTASQGLTLDDLAQQWFAYKKRDLTPRALADYQRDYANWIAPFFGHR